MTGHRNRPASGLQGFPDIDPHEVPALPDESDLIMLRLAEAKHRRRVWEDIVHRAAAQVSYWTEQQLDAEASLDNMFRRTGTYADPAALADAEADD